MFSLAGRSALVTGAGHGIGAAVAKALATVGAAVLVTDVDKDAAAAVAGEIIAAGGRAGSAVVDVRDAGQATRAAEQAAELTGGTLHIVVNNAGVIAPAMFAKMTAEQFQLVLDVHVGGTFTVSQAALPLLAERRHWPDHQRDLSRRPGRHHRPGQLRRRQGRHHRPHQVAGQGAGEEADHRERGRTAGGDRMTENIRSNEKLAELTLARIPLGRWAEPGEIAATFVFFASDAASYITGQVLPVDGGTVI